MPTAEAYEAACHQIKQAHDTLGHKQGWQFLTAPKNTFHTGVDIAFFTLLPLTEYHSEQTYSASAEQGSIFATEQWGNHAVGRAPLQKQVQAMFRQFSRLFYCSGDALLQRSLSAHLIPFRADSIEKLSAAEESKKFAQTLWKKLLPELKAKLVICIDDYSAQMLYQLLTDKQIKQAKPDTIKLNWGNVSAKVYRLPADSPSRALIRLPQLARFTIFDREKSQSSINDLIALLHTVLNEQPATAQNKPQVQATTKVQRSKAETKQRPQSKANSESSSKAKQTVDIPQSEDKPAQLVQADIPHNQDGMEDEILLTQKSQVLPSEGASHLADQVMDTQPNGDKQQQKEVKAEQTNKEKSSAKAASFVATPDNTVRDTKSDTVTSQVPASESVASQQTDRDTEASHEAPPPAIAARLAHPYQEQAETNKPPFSEKELYADEPVPRSSLVVTAIEVIVFVAASIAMITYVLR